MNRGKDKAAPSTPPPAPDEGGRESEITHVGRTVDRPESIGFEATPNEAAAMRAAAQSARMSLTAWIRATCIIAAAASIQGETTAQFTQRAVRKDDELTSAKRRPSGFRPRSR
jgi:hypothetical protein